MKERFITKNFHDSSLAIIDDANDIIAEYQAQGFSLTLRQLFYQFVARDLIPNTTRSYDRLGTIINDGRMAGLIDWLSIEDRTRERKRNSHWDNPKGVIESARDSYGIDMWSNQPYRVEVWIEKEALVGVIEHTCRALDVPFFACRGYVSQSEQWRAGVEFRNPDQHIVILHLGDHDPSGIDMTRDNFARLRMFSDDNVTVERIALNMDQIKKYNPPPNPAKVTDSRYETYLLAYGPESWELDALEPKTLTNLIIEKVINHRDNILYAERERQLANDMTKLDKIIRNLKT